MVLQTGFLISWEKIKPKFDIFKMKGLQQIFSVEGLKKMIMDICKLAVLILISWLVTRRFVYEILGLVNLDIVGIYLFLVRMIVRIIWTLLIFYGLFAIIDFAWTKYQHATRLKMTKSEVKDEFKQLEGDPHVRRKLLSLMMEESMKRMMAEIPKADVVITNPVHLAIAIKYDQAISDAPIVVAKGKRIVAERIKEIAIEHDIPVIEDKPLAQLLYKNSKVGKGIDVQFYSAVAQILSHVYTMKNKSI
jgi:flagellar biosynthetic protein FlhB